MYQPFRKSILVKFLFQNNQRVPQWLTQKKEFGTGK